MPLIINGPELLDAVSSDGLSRVVEADDGSTHVLYLDGDTVRSMPTTDWPPPLPTNPTPEQVQAAIAAREAQRQRNTADLATLRANVLALAQSAVGVRYSQLTNPQLIALFGILLWKNGAIDKDGSVLPLAQWVR